MKRHSFSWIQEQKHNDKKAITDSDIALLQVSQKINSEKKHLIMLDLQNRIGQILTHDFLPPTSAQKTDAKQWLIV